MDETYEVVLTNDARKDLKSIIDYLMEKESWSTAVKVRLALLREIETLSKMPSANGIIPEISDENLTYRKRLKWNYRIIFMIEETEKLVFVVAIDSTKQNPQKLLDALK